MAHNFCGVTKGGQFPIIANKGEAILLHLPTRLLRLPKSVSQCPKRIKDLFQEC